MASKPRHKVVATVYNKRGHILAVGVNSYTRTHPWMQALAFRLGMDYVPTLHAEVDAIIRALKRGRPHSIRVERYGKRGNPLLAKPCPICELAIKEVGIQEVTYTVGE